MPEKNWIVWLDDPNSPPMHILAARFEVHDEHLVFLRTSGQLSALFLLERVRDWSEIMMRPKILSVGSDVALLEARHQVLLSQGYEAEYALPFEAEYRLRSGQFDLLILSATVSNPEKRRLRATMTAGLKLLDLDKIVWPSELLEMIRNVC